MIQMPVHVGQAYFVSAYTTLRENEVFDLSTHLVIDLEGAAARTWEGNFTSGVEPS